MQEHNLTAIYFLTHYLVDIVKEEIGRVLKLDSISSGRVWQQADMLIFNTWHWWPTKGDLQA